MKDKGYLAGVITILVGFLISVFSPYLIVIGLPVFLIGTAFVLCSAKSIRSKLLVIIIPLLIWLPSTILFIAIFDKYINKATSQTFLIPVNYEGRFTVVYGEKCGIKPEIENGREVFVVPDNGILITQSKFKAGTIDDEYYLIDDKGNRKKINELLDFSERLKKHPGVILVSIGNFGGPVKGGYSSESPLAIKFVDYYVFNKDTVDRANGKTNNRFDSLINATVDKCRLNKNTSLPKQTGIQSNYSKKQSSPLIIMIK